MIPPDALAPILSAALLHAVWNTIIKTAANRTTTLSLVALGHFLPGAVMITLLPLVWAGIALNVAGIVLSNWRALRSGVGTAALILSFGTGICISVYSLVDGVGVRLSGNTLSYWAWGAFLHLFISGFVEWCKCQVLAALPWRVWSVGIAGGMVSMTAYSLVLYAKNFASLGAVFALRETAAIFATLIGYFLLKAGNWKRRLGAAGVMVCGIALIALNA